MDDFFGPIEFVVDSVDLADAFQFETQNQVDAAIADMERHILFIQSFTDMTDVEKEGLIQEVRDLILQWELRKHLLPIMWVH